MVGLTLTLATKAIQAAITEATTLQILECVVVVDVTGRLVAFARMDGAIQAGIFGALGKAVASALFATNSDNLAAKTVTVPPTAWVGPVVAESVGWPIPIYSQGAVPLYLPGSTATSPPIFVGAIGCGGATSAQDEQCAQAGANVLMTGNQ